MELPSNVIAVDCATVINDQVTGKINPNLHSHSSYFYIEQVLQDWSQTLNGVAAGKVVNRTGEVNAFAMNYVASADLRTGVRRSRRRAARL
jgi:hypothetical protein